MQYLLTENSIDIIAGEFNYKLWKLSKNKLLDSFTNHVQIVNKPIHISWSLTYLVYIQKPLMEQFPINVTIKNIYFSDRDAVRDVIEKDAADFHTVSTVPSSFESDLTLRTRIVRVLSEKLFHFIAQNKSFYFRVSYSINTFYLLLLKIFKIPFHNQDYQKILPYRPRCIFGLVQLIFVFVDQNQQRLVLSLNLEPYQQ